jgi:hypothetical protein
MKYKVGDILYYVDMVFNIYKVQIELTDYEYGEMFYIDGDGAYFAERDLFERLEDAKGHALTRLQEFYDKKTTEIWNAKPGLEDHRGKR